MKTWTREDLEAALDAQADAIETARAVTVALREGKAQAKDRKKAMEALEEADRLVMDLRFALIRQAARILNAKVEG